MAEIYNKQEPYDELIMNIIVFKLLQRPTSALCDPNHSCEVCYEKLIPILASETLTIKTNILVILRKET